MGSKRNECLYLLRLIILLCLLRNLAALGRLTFLGGFCSVVFGLFLFFLSLAVCCWASRKKTLF